MFNIAFCDDDVVFLNKLKQYFIEIKGENTYDEAELHMFSSGLEFLRRTENGERFDVIFIDVQMPIIGGIELANKIKKFYEPLIIFISVSNKYFVDMFDVRPLGFLNKPIKHSDFKNIFSKIYKYIFDSNDFYTFKFQKNTIRLKIKDIVYFKSHKRQVIVKCKDGEEFIFYGKILDTYEEIKGFDFILIHKSYLVNYHHISQIAYDYVIMDNGEKLNISNRRRKDVRKLYIQIGERNDLGFRECDF